MPLSAEKLRLLYYVIFQFPKRDLGVKEGTFWPCRLHNVGISSSIELITYNRKEFHNPDYYKPVSDYNRKYC
jgi:hypothetical protein